MRLFLAVFPPEEVRRRLYDQAAALRAAGGSVSWVKPENLHSTMRFLGEVGEDGARRVTEAAQAAAAAASAFDAETGRYGAFPSPPRARVLWIGLARGAEALVALARGLDGALAQRGFGRPEKPFAAHLTLGRVRDRDADWSAALAAPAGEGARFRVERLSVVESTLSPAGSIYRVRAEAPLAG